MIENPLGCLDLIWARLVQHQWIKMYNQPAKTEVDIAKAILAAGTKLHTVASRQKVKSPTTSGMSIYIFLFG